MEGVACCLCLLHCVVPQSLRVTQNQIFPEGDTESSCWDCSEGKYFFPFFFFQHFQMLLQSESEGEAGISAGSCDCDSDELLLGHRSHPLGQCKAALSQTQQHNQVMALLSWHCLGNNHQTLVVFSPWEQELGFHSLVKCLHPAPEGRNPSGLWYKALV